jgi:hypothetical protein
MKTEIKVCANDSDSSYARIWDRVCFYHNVDYVGASEAAAGRKKATTRKRNPRRSEKPDEARMEDNILSISQIK